MNAEQKAVLEFHKKFGLPVGNFPNHPDGKTIELRNSLILEEAHEFCAANTLEEKADALCDLLYVVYGAAVSYGIDLEPIFEEIHASNMSKLDVDGEPIYREDGKVLKGPNYFKPDLEREIRLQRWTGFIDGARVCPKCGMHGDLDEIAIHHNLGCDAL